MGVMKSVFLLLGGIALIGSSVRVLSRRVMISKQPISGSVTAVIVMLIMNIRKWVLNGQDPFAVIEIVVLGLIGVWGMSSAGDLSISNASLTTIEDTVEKVLGKHQIPYERPDQENYILLGDEAKFVRIQSSGSSHKIQLKNIPIKKEIFKDDFYMLIQDHRYEKFPLSGLITFLIGFGLLWLVDWSYFGF